MCGVRDGGMLGCEGVMCGGMLVCEGVMCGVRDGGMLVCEGVMCGVRDGGMLVCEGVMCGVRDGGMLGCEDEGVMNEHEGVKRVKRDKCESSHGEREGRRSHGSSQYTELGVRWQSQGRHEGGSWGSSHGWKDG